VEANVAVQFGNGSFVRPFKPPCSMIVPAIVIELELGFKFFPLDEFDYDCREMPVDRVNLSLKRKILPDM
jgi:hypothetical protein